MSSLWGVSHVLLWVAVVIQGIVILALMRQVGVLLLRIRSSPLFQGEVGPEIGEPAPWDPASAGLERTKELQLLVFMSVGCGTCEVLAPALNAISKSYRDRIAVAAVAREDSESLGVWSRRLGLRVALASAPAAFESFEVDGTPYAFVIDQQLKVVAKGGVNHVEDLETLLARCGVPGHDHELVNSQSVEPSATMEGSNGHGH